MTYELKNLSNYYQLAKSVVYKQKRGRTEVVRKDPRLTVVGSGRSAYVFRLPSTNLAMKVFYPQFQHLARKEAEVYLKLKGLPNYPKLYDSGENFIIIDYIEGSTLFECLVKGIKLTHEHIFQIERAIMLARKRGLNPSDIHLHNILLLNNNEVKIIDVARFEQVKHCQQWDDMKRVFSRYYIHGFIPKRLPRVLLNLIAYLYKRNLLTKLIR